MQNIPYELADKIEYEFSKVRNYKSWYQEVRKKVGDAIELKDGRIILFDKPDIRKRFYYSYSYMYPSLIGTVEQAQALVEKVKTDEEFFIEENMKYFLNYPNLLARGDDFFLVSTLWNQSDSKLRRISFNPYSKYELGTQDERKLILESYDNQKQKFEKRLRIYLKRFGLAKVHADACLYD